MGRPRELASRLKRYVEAPPKPAPPPPDYGWRALDEEGRPSDKEMRKAGLDALIQLDEQQQQKKQNGEYGHQVGFHLGVGGGPGAR